MPEPQSREPSTENVAPLHERELKDLLDAREDYLRLGRAQGSVRPAVLESWRRSRAFGVHPRRLERQVIDLERLRTAREEHATLMSAAEPFLELVHLTLRSEPHVVALADSTGLVLRLLAGPGLEHVDLPGSNLVEGASWRERDIGSNAVGTCLATGRPVILKGPEHFQQSYVGWTCIGAPIRDPHGAIVGALSLSVPNERAHVHGWGWALSLAQGIEANLARPSVAGAAEGAKPRLDADRLLRAAAATFDLLATELEASPAHRQFLEQVRAGLGHAEHAYETTRKALLEHGHVLAVVTHDLRNPLNAVRMASSLLLDERLPEDRKAAQVAIIQRSVDQMTRLVEDLLDAARIEGGGLRLAPEPCSADILLRDAVEHMRPLAEAESVALERRRGADATVSADRVRIGQVFDNLVANAIHHTPAGGRIEVGAEPTPAGEVRFLVRDSGRGIRPADLPRLFDRFWQAHRTGKAGAGLGLAIAKGIVEAHGGRIWAESEPGTGAVFYFTLPAISPRP